MAANEHDTGWFLIVKVPLFDLAKFTRGNDEYIDKSSDRSSQLFNNTLIYIYPRPCNSFAKVFWY